MLGKNFKFDRSGRSEGVAWVTYASEKHAAAAKEAFDGAIAKGELDPPPARVHDNRPAPVLNRFVLCSVLAPGEPIKVDFDYRIDRPLERGTPAAGSLLARVGGLSE